VEEIARVDSSQAATLAAHNSLGIGPLYYYGTEEQKMKYLPPLCTGQALWGFGLTEPMPVSDSRGTKTKAYLENGQMGDQWLEDLYHQWFCRYFSWLYSPDRYR